MKSKRIALLICLILLFGAMVEAQTPACSLPTEAQEAPILVAIAMEFHGGTMWSTFRIRPDQYGFMSETVFETLEFWPSEGDPITLYEPLRPADTTFTLGLEMLYRNDIRPELCSVERRFLAAAEG